MLRVLQCVPFAGLVSKVALTIARSLSALMVFFRPLLGAYNSLRRRATTEKFFQDDPILTSKAKRFNGFPHIESPE